MIAELEDKLAERARMHENMEWELAQAMSQKRDAEVQVTQLSNRLICGRTLELRLRMWRLR